MQRVLQDDRRRAPFRAFGQRRLSLLGAGVAANQNNVKPGQHSAAMRPCTQTGPSCLDAAMTVMGLPLPYLSLSAFLAITGLLFLSRRDNA